MTRLEINDLFMSAYIEALALTGYEMEGEKVRKWYEKIRPEIIANEEAEDD